MRPVPKGALYMGDSKVSSAEREWLFRDGGHAVGVDELLELAEAAGTRHAEFYAQIKPRMTRDRAERVRQLRCDDNWSYRKLAGICYMEWGRDADWYPETNQLAGVALCEAAAELLGENFQQYPWQANQA